MRVILKEAVGGLGKVGDVVNVADGYARNYLVPNGLAVAATPGALKEWEQKKAVIVKREAQERSEAEKLSAEINDKEVTVEAKVGAEGKLYGSVGSKEVAAAIQEQLKVEVDRKKIEVGQVIKEVGTYPVHVRVYPGVEALVKVTVVASKEE